MNVLEAAAEHIATAMIREAFAHLPPERAAGAMAMAKTEPMRRMLQASIREAFEQGRELGIRRGRLDLQREMEDDWRPVSERVRASAGQLSHAQRNTEAERQGGSHPGGPVAVW